MTRTSGMYFPAIQGQNGGDDRFEVAEVALRLEWCQFTFLDYWR